MSLAAFIFPSFHRGFLRDRVDSSHLVPMAEELTAEVATLIACALVSSGAASSTTLQRPRHEPLRCGAVSVLALPLARARTPITESSTLHLLRHVTRDRFPFSGPSHPLTVRRGPSKFAISGKGESHELARYSTLDNSIMCASESCDDPNINLCVPPHRISRSCTPYTTDGEMFQNTNPLMPCPCSGLF